MLLALSTSTRWASERPTADALPHESVMFGFPHHSVDNAGLRLNGLRFCRWAFLRVRRNKRLLPPFTIVHVGNLSFLAGNPQPVRLHLRRFVRRVGFFFGVANCFSVARLPRIFGGSVPRSAATTRRRYALGVSPVSVIRSTIGPARLPGRKVSFSGIICQRRPG